MLMEHLELQGIKTLGSDSGDNLLIKCNDVSLGPDAAVGAQEQW